MIELRAPAALAPGDTVLVWWPDWMMRRCHVVTTEHFGRRSGNRPPPPAEEVWRIVVRPVDGDDSRIEQATYRGDSELVPVILKLSAAAGELAEPVSCE